MKLVVALVTLALVSFAAAQQQNDFAFPSFNFPANPAANANQNQPVGQNSAASPVNTNTAFNAAQMPPVQGPQLTGVQFSGQATNPAAPNTLTGSVSGQNQAVNPLAQANTGFGQSAMPGMPASNFGQLQPSNALPGAGQKLTPEQQWLTVGGSRLTQNTNPTLNGNLNNGVPFNRLGFNPNNPTQFQQMGGNRAPTRFQAGAPNQGFNQNRGFNQNQGRFPQRPGFGSPRPQNGGFTDQFENFGTSGNDFMSFNVDAMGPPPTDFSAFGGPGPNDQEGGMLGPRNLFGDSSPLFGGPGGRQNGPQGRFGGPGGPQGGGGFGRPGGFNSVGLPPFVRRSMNMGFMGGPGPSPFGGGFQPGPGSFMGPFGKK